MAEIQRELVQQGGGMEGEMPEERNMMRQSRRKTALSRS